MRCRSATFHVSLCLQQFKVNSKAFNFAVIYEEYVQQELRWLRQPRNKRTAASSHEQRNDTVIVAYSASLWPLLSFCHTQPAWVHTHTPIAYKELPHTHTLTHTEAGRTLPRPRKTKRRSVLCFPCIPVVLWFILLSFVLPPLWLLICIPCESVKANKERKTMI